MPRLVGVLVAIALVGASGAAMAWASPMTGELHVPTTDLRAQFLLQIFGESTDRSVLFSSDGRLGRGGDSMLREYALSFRLPQAPQATSADWLAAGLPQVAPLTLPATLPPVDAGDLVGVAPAIVATYQAVPALPTSSPAGSTFSLSDAPASGYALAPADTDLAGRVGTAGVPSVALAVPVRVGGLRFSELFQGASEQPSTPALHDQALSSGANFTVRAGHRTLAVDLTNGYERVVRTDATPPWATGLPGAASWQLPEGPGAPSLLPAYTDVSRHSMGAAVAVPVTRALSVGLQYDSGHLLGDLGIPGASNLDAQTNTYGGSITFALPHSSSAISISAKQYRYQDNVLPANTFTQSNANVNFTVKF